MKLGYPTHPRRDLVAEIRRIAAAGFDFVDLFIEPDRCEIGRFDPKEVRRALDETGLAAVGHTAWWIPTGNPSGELRTVAAKILRDHIDVFAQMRVPMMTVHANWPHPLFTVDEGIAWQTETLRAIAPHAAERGVTILYESTDGKNDSVESIEKILAQNPTARFHADIGHLNLHGREPVACLERFKARLSHVHLHDNDGTADQHRPVGQGNVRWERVAAWLKKNYAGTVTLEIFTDDWNAVLRSRDVILDLWRKA